MSEFGLYGRLVKILEEREKEEEEVIFSRESR